MIVEMPQDFNLPATGTINYQYIRVKGNFTEDLWVQAAEMRPGNPAVAAPWEGLGGPARIEMDGGRCAGRGV